MLRQRRRVSLDKFDESLTEQSHKKMCSVGSILKKYKKTGLIDHTTSVPGKYADYPNYIDFHLMQVKIANAKSMFESIPSHIRAKFDNDPGKFVDFASNPENRNEMLEMGFDGDNLPEPVEAPQDPQPEPAPEPAPEPVPEPQA